MYEVSSEIYSETDFQQKKIENGRIISKFKFYYPSSNTNLNNDENDADILKNSQNRITDEDGDLILSRNKQFDFIEIEHLYSTTIKLVGLQVWRGALLLADFIFYNRHKFMNKKFLELGAGCGLTSIAANIYIKNHIICSDINLDDILNLIEKNIKRNENLFIKNHQNHKNIKVIEIDFKNFDLINNHKLKNELNDVEIVIAADVIYDDDLTDHFIDVLDKLLTYNFDKQKTIYIALEKRYVFTLADLETIAPCYHYFQMKCHDKNWIINDIPIDFPQYFQYERCKELVLLEVTKK